MLHCLSFRKCFVLLLILFLFSVPLCGSAETDAGLAGEWVYAYQSDETLLVLNEDGTAFYGGKALHWEDLGMALHLTTDDGSAQDLIYEKTDKGLVVYLPTAYERLGEKTDDPMVGSWKAIGGVSASTFVFTDTGKFLEDGVFTGDYAVNSDENTITFKYQDQVFADTLAYFGYVEEYLIVAYPWTLVRK